MVIDKMQSPDDKMAMTAPEVKVISLEFAGEENVISGVAAGDRDEERRRWKRVQDEEKIEECKTVAAELPICLPPLTIKIPSREFADEKNNPIVVDGEGVKEEQISERRPEEEENDECKTPKGEAYRIPAPTVCPPPPARRFKRPSKQMMEIPPEKYFPVPADLSSVFIPLKKIRTS